MENLISSSVLINISNNDQRHDSVELFVVSVFQDNKAQRLRAMKTFEGIISIGDVNLIDYLLRNLGFPNSRLKLLARKAGKWYNKSIPKQGIL